jgi:FAD-dependent halogenase
MDSRDPASKSDFDLIVVGGGPAGATVATLVAMQGHRVLLLEKEKYPLYKIGESLLPATIHGICPLLGVSEAVKEANFVVKRGGTFRWGVSETPWTFTFASSPSMAGPTSIAYQVERMKFDQILLDNAKQKGVDVRERCKVTVPLIENERVIGLQFIDDTNETTSYTAKYVVDASGHQSPLARYAGERIYSKFFQNIALFGYYKGGARLPEPNQGNIFCVAFDYGWFWFIPLSAELTSVGAVIDAKHSSLFAGGHEAAMRQFINDCPQIRDLLAQAERVTEGPYGELRIRKDYSYTNTHFWSPGLALVGDAACFVDPVFSSGVHLATYSGMLAARSINTCLNDGTSDEARCFNEFEARYRREYSNFYDFLLAFYDVNRDVDSYFWHARKITNSEEAGNGAFLDLVGGVAGSGEKMYSSTEDYLKAREGLGDALFLDASGTIPDQKVNERRQQFLSTFTSEITRVQMLATLKERRPKERPLFEGGLVPSLDGMFWEDPVKP